MRGTPYIGRRYPGVEDRALVRGAGRFVDDLHPPGLLEAAFLRSPSAHGLIRAIDTRAARALPGVHAVYTLADLRPVLTPTVCRCNFQAPCCRRIFRRSFWPAGRFHTS